MPKDRRSTHAGVARRLGIAIVSTDDLTIRREGRPGAFRYRHANGRKVAARRVAQVEKLVLPPAWADVAIARRHDAHLQAVGRDGKDRVQYRYHDEWVHVRDAVKAERLIAFGRALGAIRDRVDKDLKLPVDDRRAVIATAVRLIDRQLLRVGSEEYAREGTRGASTLLRSNAKSRKGRLKLLYRAKSGKKVELAIKDRRLRRRLDRLRRKRGAGEGGRDDRLFAWTDDEGRTRALSARQINLYLAAASGRGTRAPTVSAKDFRTFAGSALALELLLEARDAATPTARKRAATAAVKAVAERLRNTPAVARASYIHPAIMEDHEKGALPGDLGGGPLRRNLDRSETTLMRYLEARFH